MEKTGREKTDKKEAIPVNRPHVVVINTGGTIAMRAEEGKGVVPTNKLPFSALLPYLERHARITMDDYLNIPSPHMTPHHMLDVARRVRAAVARDDVHGVVITHGTDTLEETAFLLDLVVKTDKPIVVTGAMRASDELGADGPVNLLAAVRVAAHPDSRGKGVLVVFNDEIHAARYVTKTHSANVATFQSPLHGPVGTVTHTDIFYHHAPLVREHFPVDTLAENVALVKAAAGTDDFFLQACADRGVDGVVIEALGLGNLPPAMVPGVRRLLTARIPVVLVSRCYNGMVLPVYGYEGGGRQLDELGVILSSGRLNGQKARIKLMVALPLSRDMNRLREWFRQ